MISSYYWLAKPGIIYGNLLSTVAGFVLASHGRLNIGLFLATVFGISFVMGCACVLNNYLDRGIDEKMERTKNRASVTGKIPLGFGLLYAAVLGLAGFALLFFFTNALTVWIAFIGVFIYVVLYGITKRLSSFGTIVGSFSGAVPPLVGYCAVTGDFDKGALLLLLILALWQMPHFYAIAIFRSKDYAQARIPVLPLTAGVRATKLSILIFIALFVVASLGLTVYHYTGLTYMIIIGVLGLWWFAKGVAGWKTVDDQLWAKKMFKYSLVVLLVLSVAISIGSLLP